MYWAFNLVALLSMEGQKAGEFHQKYLNLCSEDEQRSYVFGTTRWRIINDRIFLFFGRTVPLSNLIQLTYKTSLFFTSCAIYFY